MIPQEKSEAVTRALQTAFGVPTFEDIADIQIHKTFSNVLVYRIVVSGAPYLLRIIMRTDDPTRHFDNMHAAAQVSLAPRVCYTSVEDRLSITDFVPTVPFPIAEARARMPHILRAVHALPPFAPVDNSINTTCLWLLHKGPAVEGFLQRFQSANILPEDETKELFARYEQIAAVYPRDCFDMVSSHNDLFKPDNILFDGTRPWLIDWEAAFLNDRYADLAAVANLITTNEAEEYAFLHTYLGHPPTACQQARLFLMQQLAHIFYATVFLMQGATAKPLDENQLELSYNDIHHQYWTGKLIPNAPTEKYLYGRFHLNQLLNNNQRQRFNESLKIVAIHHP